MCKRCAYLCPIVPMNSTLVSLGWRASCSDVQLKVSRMWTNSPKVCKGLEYRYLACAEISTNARRGSLKLSVGTFVSSMRSSKCGLTKWLDRTDLLHSCSWRVYPASLSVLEKIGWEAWTRTRIARFRIWSPANWTTSQQLCVTFFGHSEDQQKRTAAHSRVRDSYDSTLSD